MLTKICIKCELEKGELDFSPSQFVKNGAWCKLCYSSYYKENKIRINTINNNYYENNKEKILEYQKEYYEENKKEKCEKQKIYLKNNKDKRNKYYSDYEKNRKINDPTYKIRKNISNKIYNMLIKLNSSKTNNSISSYLTYTITELKNHLEKQFEPWMSWQNWGKYDPKTWNDNDTSTWTWQLDHIIPQSKLPYTSMEDDNFKKCWALENLRPYSAKLNIIENNRRNING